MNKLNRVLKLINTLCMNAFRLADSAKCFWQGLKIQANFMLLNLLIKIWMTQLNSPS